MKKFLLSLVAIFAMSSLAFAQGKADFSSIPATNTSYKTVTTTNGWKGVNCAVLGHGSKDSNPNFIMISDGEKALCMNGKTSAVGTITSPTLEGGLGILTFKYGLPYSDTKLNITISVKQNGSVVASTNLVETSITKLKAYNFEYEFNVAGDFVIEIKNNSPSNSTSNKDRVAIWNLEWEGYVESGTTTPKTAAPIITPNGGTITSNTDITITAEEGATIYYTTDGEEPTTHSMEYRAPFTLDDDATVKAIAVKPDYENSAVVSAKFFVEKKFGYVTSVTPGKKYLLVAEGVLNYGTEEQLNVSVAATPVSGDYGYLYTSKVSATNGYITTIGTDAFTINETEGGYTLQDSNGKYLYMSGTYNSFNVATELPEEGGIWTIEFNNDSMGTMTIKNTAMNKWIQYSTQYSSFGAYPNTQNNSLLPRLYEEGATAMEDPLTGVEDTMIDENAPVEYYNLQGVKVAHPENGIFIKKQGSKATKVVL